MTIIAIIYSVAIFCAKHCVKHFSVIIPFISHDRFIKYLLLYTRGQQIIDHRLNLTNYLLCN